MKNYAKSDYALNRKHPGGIAYRFRNGTIRVLTVTDFPGMPAEKFAAWKQASDDDYLKTDRSDCVESRHTIVFDNFERLGQHCEPSAEERIIDYIEYQEYLELRAARLSRINEALDTLTEKQRRRYLLHICDGFSVGEIAAFERRTYPEAENITHQSISESISRAEKLIKKYVNKPKKHPAKGSEKDV